eukprot:6204647-Pleurochrysis_carterae.AAC.2
MRNERQARTNKELMAVPGSVSKAKGEESWKVEASARCNERTNLASSNIGKDGKGSVLTIGKLEESVIRNVTPLEPPIRSPSPFFSCAMPCL